MKIIEEIKALEERFRQAELDCDQEFFKDTLADNAVIDGEHAKAKIVKAHKPGPEPKFTKVKMSDYEISEHESAAVVTCKGTFEGPKGRSQTLKFMRVWLKTENGWQIIAGTTEQVQ